MAGKFYSIRPSKIMNPRIPSISQLSILIRLTAFGVVAAFLQTAESSTITYVGLETSNGSSYPVHDWSNASIAKNHDADGNNAYGTAGYLQIRPTQLAAENVSQGASAGNDLGVSAQSNPTFGLVPAFLSSITGGGGNYVNFGGYPNFRVPDGGSIYRQGALSVSVNDGPYDSPAGADASRVGVPVQFTLGANGKFRLGLAVDSVADGNFAPDYVGVFSTSHAAGTVFSPALNRDGNPDMVFFDIVGNAGDNFIIGLWQNVATQHQYQIAALSLITFDQLPDEATSLPVLSHQIDNGNFIVSWPQGTTGWTLESSTDLGIADAWSPVSGVVGNSVSVPMTAPKIFFRLSKDN